MKTTLTILIIFFALGCSKDNGTTLTPITDTIIIPPPYQNHYGGFEASAETSCGYDAGVFMTHIDWTFWGVYDKHYYVLNHEVVGYNHVYEGTLYWSCKDITCSDKEKTGQVEIVAGKTTYLNVNF